MTTHKAYLHVDAGVANALGGSPTPAHTIIVRSGGDGDGGGRPTVGAALAQLATAYTARHGVSLDAGRLDARLGGTVLEREATLADVVPPGADVWAGPRAASAGDEACARPPPPPRPPPTPPSSTPAATSAVVDAILARADAAAAAGRLAAAAGLYDKLVAAAPGHRGAALGRARVWARAGRAAEAAAAAAEAAAAHPADAPAAALLADCLLELGDLDGALAAFDAALAGPAGGGGSGSGRPPAAHPPTPLSPAGRAAALAGVADVLVSRFARLPTGTAHETLAAAHDAAKGAVEAALAADGRSARALVAYARLARAGGAVPAGGPAQSGAPAAARALLRALAAHPQDQGAQRALADVVVRDPGGEAAMWAELRALGVRAGPGGGGGGGGGPRARAAAPPRPPPSADADAAALAFLASCLKAHGAARASGALSAAAAIAAPGPAVYALAAAQTAELWGDPAAPAAIIAAWCARNAGAAGPPRALETALAVVGRACAGLPPRPPGAGALGWLFLGGEGGGAGADPAARARPPSLAATDADGRPGVAYTEPQLDALALACTALRVLYTGGALARAAAAAAALAPVRAAARPPLHAGRARNEAAYAACVTALLLDPRAAPALPTGGDAADASRYDPVYVLGDSHTLPLAWRVLRGGGGGGRGARAAAPPPPQPQQQQHHPPPPPPPRPRLLVPLLVTGLKVWHLRPGGAFFPRAAWDAAVAALPRRGRVITLAGEIDAREGLLLAVAKLKYDSLAAAVAAAAAAYGSALAALVADERALAIAVHPVPPVLDETRHVVRALNAAVRAEVGRLGGRAGGPGTIAFLDLEDRLLTPDGARLRPELGFDGTHLSPAYTADLEGALGEVGWW